MMLLSSSFMLMPTAVAADDGRTFLPVEERKNVAHRKSDENRQLFSGRILDKQIPLNDL